MSQLRTRVLRLIFLHDYLKYPCLELIPEPLLKELKWGPKVNPDALNGVMCNLPFIPYVSLSCEEPPMEYKSAVQLGLQGIRSFRIEPEAGEREGGGGGSSGHSKANYAKPAKQEQILFFYGKTINTATGPARARQCGLDGLSSSSSNRGQRINIGKNKKTTAVQEVAVSGEELHRARINAVTGMSLRKKSLLREIINHRIVDFFEEFSYNPNANDAVEEQNSQSSLAPVGAVRIAQGVKARNMYNNMRSENLLTKAKKDADFVRNTKTGEAQIEVRDLSIKMLIDRKSQVEVPIDLLTKPVSKKEIAKVKVTLDLTSRYIISLPDAAFKLFWDRVCALDTITQATMKRGVYVCLCAKETAEKMHDYAIQIGVSVLDVPVQFIGPDFLTVVKGGESVNNALLCVIHGVVKYSDVFPGTGTKVSTSATPADKYVIGSLFLQRTNLYYYRKHNMLTTTKKLFFLALSKEDVEENDSKSEVMVNHPNTCLNMDMYVNAAHKLGHLDIPGVFESRDFTHKTQLNPKYSPPIVTISRANVFVEMKDYYGLKEIGSTFPAGVDDKIQNAFAKDMDTVNGISNHETTISGFGKAFKTMPLKYYTAKENILKVITKTVPNIDVSLTSFIDADHLFKENGYLVLSNMFTKQDFSGKIAVDLPTGKETLIIHEVLACANVNAKRLEEENWNLFYYPDYLAYVSDGAEKLKAREHKSYCTHVIRAHKKMKLGVKELVDPPKVLHMFHYIIPNGLKLLGLKSSSSLMTPLGVSPAMRKSWAIALEFMTHFNEYMSTLTKVMKLLEGNGVNSGYFKAHKLDKERNCLSFQYAFNYAETEKVSGKDIADKQFEIIQNVVFLKPQTKRFLDYAADVAKKLQHFDRSTTFGNFLLDLVAIIEYQDEIDRLKTLKDETDYVSLYIDTNCNECLYRASFLVTDSTGRTMTTFQEDKLLCCTGLYKHHLEYTRGSGIKWISHGISQKQLEKSAMDEAIEKYIKILNNVKEKTHSHVKLFTEYELSGELIVFAEFAAESMPALLQKYTEELKLFFEDSYVWEDLFEEVCPRKYFAFVPPGYVDAKKLGKKGKRKQPYDAYLRMVVNTVATMMPKCLSSPTVLRTADKTRYEDLQKNIGIVQEKGYKVRLKH
eukprot:Nk52_evm10s503 gene=Nk52_evmTU10s503